MRRSDKKLDDRKAVESLLIKEQVGHIRADPRVVFEVERDVGYLAAKNDPCGASFAYSCVIIRGRAELVESSTEKIKILAALMSKYQPGGGYGQFNEKMVEKTAVVKIVVESITGKTSPAK